ncbi:ArsR/SmtB family transcription factor [Streptococcus suis]|uniref:ArsR/SmtB family transcription factor n=1 Tax=Streptococcus suis TaxID=1307 RepID=UPI000412C28A|nr:metalloregulator ArsR/SmtB family transcription factor [Streptococcus suis]MBM7284578.1 winged helix-turn-helix transcriptional regulator [Streptococcus suis]MCO8237667.1 metalloregulator ArsR/SmtB family transcription factor [Streptococcus suis]HEM3533096.1 winged helix-turn-helix transcriptional regulator [Streptococcus suis]
MNNEICEITCIHEDKVNRAKSKLANFDTPSVSGFFKILSDENRLKIVHALVHEDELCVCDIANIIDASVATTSHHLNSLKKLGVVDSHKDGKLVYYFIKNIKILNLMELVVNFKEEVLA